ncbi:MAG: hypothetical protein A3J67_03040 [Parcubacteria group bacterium RIFCSPHIGHO2_02_FULL_48_10b]|nr:MAG: hypothetical protein A3J67_03040 [Parcubacteria group bacterium RIFCSPHIGHO2_02_FULL_48_10b]
MKWRLLQLFVLVFAIPVGAYLFIRLEPTDANNIGFGGPLLLFSYWLWLYLIERHSSEAGRRKRQLKRLLDGVMEKEELARLKRELEHEPYFLDEMENSVKATIMDMTDEGRKKRSRGHRYL